MIADPDAVVFPAKWRLQRSDRHVHAIEDKDRHIRIDFHLDGHPFVQALGNSVHKTFFEDDRRVAGVDGRMDGTILDIDGISFFIVAL